MWASVPVSSVMFIGKLPAPPDFGGLPAPAKGFDLILLFTKENGIYIIYLLFFRFQREVGKIPLWRLLLFFLDFPFGRLCFSFPIEM
jgi:hypothetical protein